MRSGIRRCNGANRASFRISSNNCRPRTGCTSALTVKQPVAGGFGLHGSGMFILNPPWLLPKALELAMPYLAKALAQDAAAGFSLESELA